MVILPTENNAVRNNGYVQLQLLILLYNIATSVN